MNRNPFLWSNAPLLAWSRLGLNTGEMLAASAQVMQQWTQRIVQAGPVPYARDPKEFRSMGQEKLEAAGESFQAMGWQMLRMNQMLAGLLFKQWTDWATSAAQFATPPFWLWSGKEYQQWLNQAQRSGPAVGNQSSTTTAQLAGHGLEPAHSRAKANAQRLLH